MKQQNRLSTKTLALTGVATALVFILTKFVSIPIPSAIGKTAIHVGNAMCLLSSLLLGPVPGALAAGIGSALVDLTDPVWATEFWMTFINKAAMALTAGLCFRVLRLHNRPLRVWLSSLSGALVYCVLYVAKNILMGHLVRGLAWTVAIVETLTLKLPVTLTNAVIATICASLLYLAMKPALTKAHVLD
ncbi:MAG: ECF transporter S component [Oscillospiraceae bacterium]|nr:ECF transporter S component [Oscillospiraceae bacterium]